WVRSGLAICGFRRDWFYRLCSSFLDSCRTGTMSLAPVFLTRRRQKSAPSPQRGRGAGGEGDTSQLNELPKPLSGWHSEIQASFISLLAPSPLTPLPRWGEGNSSLSRISRHDECSAVTIPVILNTPRGSVLRKPASNVPHPIFKYKLQLNN